MSFGRETYCVIGDPQTGEARELRGLRISFEVVKRDGAAINTGKLTIYNPSPDSCALAARRGAYVQLYAGYLDAGGAALIFTGSITRAVATRERPEIRLEIESGDGQAAIAASSQTTLQGSTSLRDALGPLADAAQLGLDYVGVNPDEVLSAPRGLTLSGPALGSINRIAKLNRLDWTIDNGRLILLARGAATQLPALLVSAQTGLIGSPAAGDKGRVVFKMLLSGEVRLRRVIQLDSLDFKGWVLVRGAKFMGDSGYDAAYYVEVEASGITPQVTR